MTADLAEYLIEIESAKELYEQYMEVSQIYKLPVFQPQPEPQYAPPSSENPLTTNVVTLTI
ncbi:hypothetical protein [Candidatus Spongiihabitans sp.]|uniref:hypothetical protein n=1 Tax=Candidatus Spongiihabitans sp. TaxID=3101308 RepID=UPI003C7BBE8C